MSAAIRSAALILSLATVQVPVVAAQQAETAAAPTASATALTLDEALRVALDGSPRALAARASFRATSGEATTYGVLANPTLEYKSVDALDPGGSGNFEASLGQDVEWAGQWLVRRSAARHLTETAAHLLADEQRRLARDVEAAFFAAVAAGHKLAVHEDGAQLTTELLRAVTAQERQGQVSALDVNLASVQAGRFEADGMAARQEHASSLRSLAALIGMEPGSIGEIVQPSDGGGLDLASAEAAVAAALANRPDHRAAISRSAAADDVSRLARLDVLPTVNLAAVADRNGSGAPTTYGFRISMPVPLWDRNQGERMRSGALSDLTAAERRGSELLVRAEAVNAWEGARSADMELEIYDARVLEPARSNRALLERARQAGRLDLPTTLLLQTQLLEAELSYWDAWLRARTAQADLRAAVGGD